MIAHVLSAIRTDCRIEFSFQNGFAWNSVTFINVLLEENFEEGQL